MTSVHTKAISIILAVSMIFSVFAINSSAETEYEGSTIMPRLSVINKVTATFTISGVTSTSSVFLYSQYSTSLHIKIELQKDKSSGYETIETWEKSGTGTYLSLDKDRLINVLSDYRIKVTCTAGGETCVRYAYP